MFNTCSCFGLIILISVLCLCCGDDISCLQVLLGVVFASTLACRSVCSNATANGNGNGNGNGNNTVNGIA